MIISNQMYGGLQLSFVIWRSRNELVKYQTRCMPISRNILTQSTAFRRFIGRDLKNRFRNRATIQEEIKVGASIVKYFSTFRQKTLQNNLWIVDVALFKSLHRNPSTLRYTLGHKLWDR